MPGKITSILWFIAFWLGACAFPLQAAPLVERVLTLDDSVQSGMNNNQELLALREQIGTAQQRINEARSQIYPKIDFNLSASRFNNDVPTVLTPSFNSLFLPQGRQDLYYSTRFSLWQYLYAGGRYTTTLRLAEINLSQAQSQADAVRNRIILDVKNSFYSCIALKEKIAACGAAIKEIEELSGHNSFIRGKWQGSLAPLRREQVRLRHEYDKAKLQHLQIMGLELDTVIELSGSLVKPSEEYELNKCQAWAFQYRPELRQTQFQETIDSLHVSLSITERYPTVTLGANYEWTGGRLPLDNTNWNATINLNVPVFDGWASWARVKQRRYQAREGKIRRARIEDQILYEVRDAYLDYMFWTEQAAFLEESAPLQPGQPEKRLEDALARIDTLRQMLSSQATLEWAIGKAFFK